MRVGAAPGEPREGIGIRCPTHIDGKTFEIAWGVRRLSNLTRRDPRLKKKPGTMARPKSNREVEEQNVNHVRFLTA